MSTPTDLQRYLGAQETMEATRRELEGSPEVASFNTQLGLLRRHLAANPNQFRQLVINDGMAGVAAGRGQRATPLRAP